MLTASCENSEPSPTMLVAHEGKGNAHDTKLIEGESSLDGLKLMSSLNTFGYIKFVVLCNLRYLEEKLYAFDNLPWLSRHIYHVFGKYNNKGQYMMQ